MSLFLYILIAAPALMILFEDVKTRTVTAWKIILLAATTILFFLLTNESISDQLKVASYNFGIIAVIYFALVGLYFFKEKKLSFSLKGKMGLADLLLAFPPALCFSNFIFLYFILACTFCALVYAAVLFFTEQENKITIPLAGISSLLFFAAIVLFNQFGINYSDNSGLFEQFILQ